MKRKLNQTEINVLAKLRKRQKVSKHVFTKRDELTVEYAVNGNFTVAVVDGLKKTHVGVSKFNPADLHYNEEIGRQLAFARAFKS